MKSTVVRTRRAPRVLFAALLFSAAPLIAQSSPPADPEPRLRKIEAEVRALQRQVFPGSDGKFFAPQVTPGAAVNPGSPSVPATTPVTDLLTRMDSVEAQIARLTAQSEETANRVAQIEARLATLAPPAPAPGTETATVLPAPAGATPAAVIPGPSLAVASGAASAPSVEVVTRPAPANRPAATPPVTVKPAATKPAPAAKPSPQRVAAVQKIVKPDTGNAGDD